MGERERGPLGNTPRSAATMATEDSGLFCLPLMHVIASVLVNFLSIRAKLPRAAQISRGNPWCECNFLPRATVGGAQSAVEGEPLHGCPGERKREQKRRAWYLAGQCRAMWSIWRYHTSSRESLLVDLTQSRSLTVPHTLEGKEGKNN